MIKYLSLLAATFGFADHTEKLVVEGELVYVISSFEQVDYFSTFSKSGDFTWEIPFSTRLQSWKKEGDVIYILSQHKNQLVYYVSCVDAMTGKVLWEKGVYSPEYEKN